jgi:hypothetical protein
VGESLPLGLHLDMKYEPTAINQEVNQQDMGFRQDFKTLPKPTKGNGNKWKPPKRTKYLKKLSIQSKIKELLHN